MSNLLSRDDNIQQSGIFSIPEIQVVSSSSPSILHLKTSVQHHDHVTETIRQALDLYERKQRRWIITHRIFKHLIFFILFCLFMVDIVLDSSSNVYDLIIWGHLSIIFGLLLLLFPKRWLNETIWDGDHSFCAIMMTSLNIIYI